MQLENSVIKELTNHGYPIYYHNLRIRKNRTIITEYDIVSEKFIIEVKSGHDISNYNSQFQTQLQYLPKGYNFYCYCPYISIEMIYELNNRYNSIIFINNLEVIYKNQTVKHVYNIKNQKDLTRLIALPFDHLKIFRQLYTTSTTFHYTYLCVNFINDYYNSIDKMFASEKLEYLIDNNILKISNKLSKIIPYITTNTLRNKIDISRVRCSSYNKLNLNKWYSIYWCKEYAKSIDLNNQLPIVENVTVMCKCNCKTIFIKEGACGYCKRGTILF